MVSSEAWEGLSQDVDQGGRSSAIYLNRLTNSPDILSISSAVGIELEVDVSVGGEDTPPTGGGIVSGLPVLGHLGQRLKKSHGLSEPHERGSVCSTLYGACRDRLEGGAS